jgi:hypothetical protein
VFVTPTPGSRSVLHEKSYSASSLWPTSVERPSTRPPTIAPALIGVKGPSGPASEYEAVTEQTSLVLSRTRKRTTTVPDTSPPGGATISTSRSTGGEFPTVKRSVCTVGPEPEGSVAVTIALGLCPSSSPKSAA